MWSFVAGVVKLVDAPDSKSGSERSVGSIPTLGTNEKIKEVQIHTETRKLSSLAGFLLFKENQRKPTKYSPNCYLFCYLRIITPKKVTLRGDSG